MKVSSRFLLFRPPVLLESNTLHTNSPNKILKLSTGKSFLVQSCSLTSSCTNYQPRYWYSPLEVLLVYKATDVGTLKKLGSSKPEPFGTGVHVNVVASVANYSMVFILFVFHNTFAFLRSCQKDLVASCRLFALAGQGFPELKLSIFRVDGSDVGRIFVEGCVYCGKNYQWEEEDLLVTRSTIIENSRTKGTKRRSNSCCDDRTALHDIPFGLSGVSTKMHVIPFYFNLILGLKVTSLEAESIVRAAQRECGLSFDIRPSVSAITGAEDFVGIVRKSFQNSGVSSLEVETVLSSIFE
ncbi:hypothetical protein Tco_0990032 [Tanacetum coccineum]|uniref:Uncharacterized protein n=1 Tax=Tanacetum coccineum TaxID=301880 RepID=A0ABQ5EW34_9ASTR